MSALMVARRKRAKGYALAVGGTLTLGLGVGVWPIIGFLGLVVAIIGAHIVATADQEVREMERERSQEGRSRVAQIRRMIETGALRVLDHEEPSVRVVDRGQR